MSTVWTLHISLSTSQSTNNFFPTQNGVYSVVESSHWSSSFPTSRLHLRMKYKLGCGPTLVNWTGQARSPKVLAKKCINSDLNQVWTPKVSWKMLFRLALEHMSFKLEWPETNRSPIMVAFSKCSSCPVKQHYLFHRVKRTH